MNRYELTDEDYQVIAPFLPPERTGKPGRPHKSHRQILNGIFWILRTGAPWRDLPERYGPWSTVYDRFRRWSKMGIWQKILDALEGKARKMDRIDFEFSAMDGSIVRAHKSAAGAQKKRGNTRRKP
jgi:transposase